MPLTQAEIAQMVAGILVDQKVPMAEVRGASCLRAGFCIFSNEGTVAVAWVEPDGRPQLSTKERDDKYREWAGFLRLRTAGAVLARIEAGFLTVRSMG